MAKEKSNGMMVNSLKVISKTIRSKEKVYFSGRMVKNILEIGEMAFKMEQEFTI